MGDSRVDLCQDMVENTGDSGEIQPEVDYDIGTASDYVGHAQLEMYYGMTEDRYVQADIFDEMVEIIPEELLHRFPSYKFSTHIIDGIKSQLNPGSHELINKGLKL